jgi:hypothetical protein
MGLKHRLFPELQVGDRVRLCQIDRNDRRVCEVREAEVVRVTPFEFRIYGLPALRFTRSYGDEVGYDPLCGRLPLTCRPIGDRKEGQS